MSMWQPPEVSQVWLQLQSSCRLNGRVLGIPFRMSIIHGNKQQTLLIADIPLRQRDIPAKLRDRILGFQQRLDVVAYQPTVHMRRSE